MGFCDVRPHVFSLILLLTTSSSGIGPPLGGILANAGAWRWLFYLNLPIFGIAAALEIVFLHNTPPEATVRQKLKRMDWL